jgi:hypothetical protein
MCDLTFYYASLLPFILLLFVKKKRVCWFAAKQLGFSLRRRSGRLLCVGKNNGTLITLSDKEICYMLTERLQVKTAFDGPCTVINREMLGHVPQGG